MLDSVGIIMLSFGEPESPTMDEVVPFLERIFYSNAPLERFPDDDSRRKRAQELARSRAPGLIADYARIGGSPLNAQAREEADIVENVLRERGLNARTYVAMQFTDPAIPEIVVKAKNDGVDALIALPIYPICGFSTNVAALEAVQKAVKDLKWSVPIQELAAWHHDPAYVRLRAENIREFAAENEVDLLDPDTLLYFSAHGTPVKYLELGSRYDGYVEEHCAQIADLLGGVRYTIGYQNHTNRGIAWTEPGNEEHLNQVEAKRLVVEPVSFVHEQSETLSELDIDFKAEVEAREMQFYRVPVLTDRVGLATVLADLVTPLLEEVVPTSKGLHACQCRPRRGTVCTNGSRKVDCHYARTLVAK